MTMPACGALEQDETTKQSSGKTEAAATLKQAAEQLITSIAELRSHDAFKDITGLKPLAAAEAEALTLNTLGQQMQVVAAAARSTKPALDAFKRFERAAKAFARLLETNADQTLEGARGRYVDLKSWIVKGDVAALPPEFDSVEGIYQAFQGRSARAQIDWENVLLDFCGTIGAVAVVTVGVLIVVTAIQLISPEAHPPSGNYIAMAAAGAVLWGSITCIARRA
ncbi:MAG: hypothetical protein H6707_02595 [Deltaproteobacteria bacterium]|nr:hypothetical protein [Deltaproteobacteria bacterium]